MGRKINLFLCVTFLFLVVIPFTNAQQPPFQQITINEGVEIVFPQINVLEEGQDFEFHFHTINESNGVILNSTHLDCTFHLYNKTGSHQYQINYSVGMDANAIDWAVDIDGNNFTSGVYSYLFGCNSTAQQIGGFVEVGFEVTSTGTILNTPKALVYLGLFAIIIFTFIVTFVGIGFLPKSNTKNEEGKIIQISYLKYLRPALWFVEWMLFISILFLASNLSYAYLGEQLFAEILFVLYRICFGITPLIVVVWMISFYVKFFQDREFQKMLNKGFFPQGKL